MPKKHLHLQPTEQTLTLASAQIYATYLNSGKVTAGNEEEWLRRSVAEAVRLACLVDESVAADHEMG